VTSVGGLLQSGAWSHVVATWDGSSAAAGIHLYVDGTEAARQSVFDGVGTRNDDSAVPFNLNCNGGGMYGGAINDVRLFDRVLTPTEIAAL
jgi:hypothetical protein